MAKRFSYIAVTAVSIGCASAASAQSSVTLYGMVDAGIEFANHQPNGGNSVVRLQSGNPAGSRWGLRGVEDLGSGYQAVFVLESGFDIDTGASAQGRLFGRQAYVGAGTKDSKLLFGRQYTVLYAYGLIFDPLLLAPRYSIVAVDPGGIGGRTDNTVKFTGNYGPIYTEASYSFGADGTQGVNGEVPGNSKVGREYGGMLVYSGGSYDVGLAYEEIRGSTVATADDRLSRAAVAGTVKIGDAKAFVGYRYRRQTTGPATAIGDLYWAGVKYPFGQAFSVSGGVYYTNNHGSGADPWMYVVSSTYSLSKRTSIYSSVAYTKNKSGSALGVNGYNTVLPGANQLGAVISLRHIF